MIFELIAYVIFVVQTKSAGLNRSDALKIAENSSPALIEVDVQEDEDIISLSMKWKKNSFPVTREESYAIFKKLYEGDVNPEIEKILAKRTEEEIRRAIMEFGRGVCDKLIAEFHLEDIYRQKYEDRNYIYKVKSIYEINNIGKPLSSGLSLEIAPFIIVNVPQIIPSAIANFWSELRVIFFDSADLSYKDKYNVMFLLLAIKQKTTLLVLGLTLTIAVALAIAPILSEIAYVSVDPTNHVCGNSGAAENNPHCN